MDGLLRGVLRLPPVRVVNLAIFNVVRQRPGRRAKWFAKPDDDALFFRPAARAFSDLISGGELGLENRFQVRAQIAQNGACWLAWY